MNDGTFLGLFDKQKSIIIGIALATAGFFWQVIIPINNIQAQLATIQSQLSGSIQSYQNVQLDQSKMELQLTTLQIQVANLQKVLHL